MMADRRWATATAGTAGTSPGNGDGGTGGFATTAAVAGGNASDNGGGGGGGIGRIVIATHGTAPTVTSSPAAVVRTY